MGAPVEEISCADVKAMLDAGKAVALVDCRREDEWEIARIEGATLVPLAEMLARLGEVRKAIDGAGDGAEVVVYCRSGRRSMTAVRVLRLEGIAAKSMSGGILRWADEIDSSLERY